MPAFALQQCMYSVRGSTTWTRNGLTPPPLPLQTGTESSNSPTLYLLSALVQETQWALDFLLAQAKGFWGRVFIQQQEAGGDRNSQISDIYVAPETFSHLVWVFLCYCKHTRPGACPMQSSRVGRPHEFVGHSTSACSVCMRCKTHKHTKGTT